MKSNSKSRDAVWLTRSAVAKRVGYSRQTVWQWEAKGLFPKPDGASTYGDPLWLVTTVDEFLKGGAKAA